METSTKPLLQVVIASTRPGRAGGPVGQWVAELAREHDGFEVEILDLAEVNLPMMDEPNHPKMRQYQHAHTLAWSETIDRADAFVFVMPEYNHGITAPLKNAIDYLSQEWAHKPVGIVSYGGVAAGARAVQQLKQILPVLRLVPVADAVHIPFVHAMIKDGSFEPTPMVAAGAKGMLDELAKLAPVLKQLR